MARDSVGLKEDEARDAAELLLKNGDARLTETNESSEQEKLTREQEDVTDNEPESEDADTLCGLGSYHPSWLQWFASKKTYVVVFGLIGMMQIAIATYYISIISTLEKRFKICSRTSGIIIAAWDIGVLCSNLFLAYLGSRGHKTRWVAAGSFLAATSCFMLHLLHVIFGPGHDALDLTYEYNGDFEMTTNLSQKINSTGDSSKALLCRSEYESLEDCSISGTSTIPTVILFVANMLIGIGTSVYYTLGITYMDDNVRKHKTPFLLAVWQCIRLMGPTFGFLLGSYTLQFYVDPSLHPTITVDDPRWIGAWWLGWVPLGVLMAALSLILALFPRKLPRAARRSKLRGEPPSTTTTKSFSDFKMVMQRLLRNKVLLFNSFSSVCFMFALMGYWTFMPKYIETQFRRSASTANFIQGTIGLIFTALGILASGTVISVFKPRARYLAGWNVLAEILDAAGRFSFIFLNCGVDDLHGSRAADQSWDLIASCNADCDCGPMVKYSPICSSDGSTTFYSPCHAGCTTMELLNGTKMFGNCSCIDDGSGWTKDGACPVDCTTTFAIFLVIQCTISFLSASGRTGNTIIQFRCVDKEDKSMSIGLSELLLSSFAFIPAPIFYGMLLDSACMVWGQTCGKSGNCWLYDAQELGYLLNLTASALVLVGTLLDVGVWYYVKDLKIYDDPDVEKEKNKRRTISNSSRS